MPVPADPEDPLSLLLVEDDRADAMLVEELIADAGYRHPAWCGRSRWPRRERETRQRPPGLRAAGPESARRHGIDGARPHRQAATRRIPIVVLTGLNDEHFGVSAVGVGRAGLPGQGPGGTRDAAARGAATPSSASAPSSRRSTCTPASCGRGRTPGWSAGCCPLRCCWTTPVSTSSPSTGPAARTHCSAATSTTSCRRRTAPSTS